MAGSAVFAASLRPCPVCGVPFSPANGKRYCGAECKDLETFLGAATRKLRAISFYETPDGRAAKIRVRGRIRGLANKLGNRWQRPRDAAGKFMRREATWPAAR